MRPDEQVDEAEVERVETVKSGKNGATERVARPERDVRLAPEGAATPATAEVRQHPAISATADEPSAKSATAAGASTSSWGRRPAGQAQPSSETAATPATTGGVNGTEKPATSATAGAGTARGKR